LIDIFRLETLGSSATIVAPFFDGTKVGTGKVHDVGTVTLVFYRDRFSLSRNARESEK
jgi:hypothetical protein